MHRPGSPDGGSAGGHEKSPSSNRCNLSAGQQRDPQAPVTTNSETQILLPVRLIAMDVDGVLTRGDVTYVGGEGELLEAKAFNVRDGLGFGLARQAGLKIAWITGRCSAVVDRRAAELGIDVVRQGVRDKGRVLRQLQQELGVGRAETLYAGDDLNDLLAFEEAAVTVAPSDGLRQVQEAAAWVTDASGGGGVAREIIDAVLAAQGRLDEVAGLFLDSLRQEGSSPVQ